MQLPKESSGDLFLLVSLLVEADLDAHLICICASLCVSMADSKATL